MSKGRPLRVCDICKGKGGKRQQHMACGSAGCKGCNHTGYVFMACWFCEGRGQV